VSGRYTEDMADTDEDAVRPDVRRAELSVSADGRVTIPAQLRREAGIQPGSALVCYVENGRVVFEDRGHLLARVQDEVLAAEAAAGHTGSAVEELIAERRAEAAREADEDSGNEAGL